MGKAVPGRTRMSLNVLVSMSTGKRSPGLTGLRTRSSGFQCVCHVGPEGLATGVRLRLGERRGSVQRVYLHTKLYKGVSELGPTLATRFLELTKGF